MKQITITIPENFYKTFLEFFKHIPDAKIEETESFFVPEWHKKESMKRISESQTEDFIPWETAKKKLKRK